MSFYAHALRLEEITKLGNIYAEIGNHIALRRVAQIGLKDFAERFERRDDLNSDRLTQLFKHGRLPQDASLNALLYDYMTTDFVHKLRDQKLSKKLKDKLSKQIREFTLPIKSRIRRLDHPFVGIARDIEIEDVQRVVPPEFIKQFVGYRWSSSGSLLRFYINIRKYTASKRAMVWFTNRYHRGSTKWKVKGGGVYSRNNTLYLLGHAKNENGLSTGYRMMALRHIADSEMISGVLISMDRQEPIAARVLFIPWKLHDFKGICENPRPTIANIETVIKSKTNSIHSDEYKAYASALLGSLQKQFSDEEEGYLFRHISNFTVKTLKTMTQSDNRLADVEIGFRKRENEFLDDIEERVARVMQNDLDIAR